MNAQDFRTQSAFDKLVVAAFSVQEKRLDGIVSLAWQAQCAGHLNDDQAVKIQDAVQVRREVFGARRRVRYASKEVVIQRPVHSRSALRGQRVMWGGSGALPPHLRSQFTPGELAVAGVIRAEVRRHGRCSLSYSCIAQAAGLMSTTVVKRFVRQAKKSGLISVRERRVAHNRNEPNVITIISADWKKWNETAVSRGGGGTTVPAYQNKKISNVRASSSTGDSVSPLATEHRRCIGLGEGESRSGSAEAGRYGGR